MEDAEEGPEYPPIILIFLTGADAGPGYANIYFSSMLFFHTERRGEGKKYLFSLCQQIAAWGGVEPQSIQSARLSLKSSE